MFPLDLLESRLGSISDRAFDAASAGAGVSQATSEELDEQRLLTDVDRHPDQVEQTTLAGAIESGLVQETDGGFELTPLGRYKLRG